MRELARLAGISQPGLRAVCLGTYPTDSTLQKLAQALGRSSRELSTLAYERKVKLQEAHLDEHDVALFKELLAIAREMDLEAPKTIPSSKMKIRKALIDLGFSSTNSSTN